MENYMMTSIESDEMFVDNMADASVNSPEYMTDEERDEANDLDLTDEEEEASYETIEDTQVNTLADCVFGGMSQSESFRAANQEAVNLSKKSASVRKAVKKALVNKVPNLPTSKYVEHRQELYAERLAGHFNHEGVK